MNDSVGGINVGDDDVSAIDCNASVRYDYGGCPTLHGGHFCEFYYLCSSDITGHYMVGQYGNQLVFILR